jgi:hypothetical protein
VKRADRAGQRLRRRYDVVGYPEHGYAWVATRDPDPKLLARGGDPGIIARFEITIE